MHWALPAGVRIPSLSLPQTLWRAPSAQATELCSRPRHLTPGLHDGLEIHWESFRRRCSQPARRAPRSYGTVPRMRCQTRARPQDGGRSCGTHVVACTRHCTCIGEHPGLSVWNASSVLKGLKSNGFLDQARQCVRAAKDMDSKSIGFCQHDFESPRCRVGCSLAFSRFE